MTTFPQRGKNNVFFSSSRPFMTVSCPPFQRADLADPLLRRQIRVRDQDSLMIGPVRPAGHRHNIGRAREDESRRLVTSGVYWGN